MMSPRRPVLETTLVAPWPANHNADDDPDGPAPLNVLIAYEDGSSVRRALRVVCQLANQEGAPVQLQTKFWRFALLENDAFRAEALRDAHQADMIIVSTRDVAALAAPASHWLEEALADRNETQIALLALFGSSDAWSFTLRDESNFRSIRHLGGRRPEPVRAFAPSPLLVACA